mmetsp:Transcript_33305/g.81018  ORF Transcript_33305/g.81018 Transcript_33305/m.81018 type:complete len:325 (+) Transcript_33305:336-1310(+)
MLNTSPHRLMERRAPRMLPMHELIVAECAEEAGHAAFGGELQHVLPRVGHVGRDDLVVIGQCLHGGQPHDGLQEVLEAQVLHLHFSLWRLGVHREHARPHEDHRGVAVNQILAEEAAVLEQLHPLGVAEQRGLELATPRDGAARAEVQAGVDGVQIEKEHLVPPQHAVSLFNVAVAPAEGVRVVENHQLVEVWEDVASEETLHRIRDVRDGEREDILHDGDAHNGVEELLLVERDGGVVVGQRGGRSVRIARRAVAISRLLRGIDEDKQLVEVRLLAMLRVLLHQLAIFHQLSEGVELDPFKDIRHANRGGLAVVVQPVQLLGV